MKIKVQFTFEGKLPLEHEDLATASWGDKEVSFILVEVEGDIELVLIRRRKDGFDCTNLRTKCLTRDIIEVS